jgi:electron transfer flavoprotein alpha subunit
MNDYPKLAVWPDGYYMTANEFTAGMEKSHQVIAINTDPRARIFQFADLGVVGDVHAILPRLTERIEEEQHGVQDS